MTEINDHKTFWKRSTMEIITYTEGSLADIIQLARKDILSLITTIESLQKQNGNLKESWDEQKEEIRSMRHALSMANEKNGGDYYAWMPFEENHLESLSCPVLIEADWIRQLISLETKPLNEKIESQKEEIERVRQAAKHWQDRYDGTAPEIESLKAITELAVKGLQFYADEENYDLEQEEHYIKVTLDRGDNARTTISKIERLSQ